MFLHCFIMTIAVGEADFKREKEREGEEWKERGRERKRGREREELRERGRERESEGENSILASPHKCILFIS